MNRILIATLIITLCAADAAQDKFQWPGLEYTFATYSGYLTVDESDERDLHYLFVESENDDDANKPVVLWLNGGPGCSSVLGLLQEIGPFIIDNGEVNFKPNEWTWQKEAHILILEQPSGVGFAKSPKDSDFKYTDEQVGADNYKALKAWFERFPLYKNRKFWITGESYAGMYIPYTAKAIIDGEEPLGPEEKSINLQGVMIGNGVLIIEDQFRESAATSFMVRRNFIDRTNQFILDHQCNINPKAASCKAAQRAYNSALDSINPYNVYGYCWGDSTKQQWKQSHSVFIIVQNQARFPYTPWVTKLGEDDDNSDAPCIDFGPLANELNKDEVKSALHVEPTITWVGCSPTVFKNYERNPEGSYKILSYLASKGQKILLYSGDQDLAVSMVETYKSIQRIPGIKELTGTVRNNNLAWTPVLNQNQAGENFEQLAGWIVEYDILTYWVVRGAGHMVPQDQRENAYFMFKDFLNRK